MAKYSGCFQPWSCGDDRDEAVDVALVVVDVGRDADFIFTQAGDDVFAAQFVVILLAFLRGAGLEAAVRSAMLVIERAGDDETIQRQAGKKLIDQFVIVSGDDLRADAQDQFQSGLKCREIVIVGGFRGVPASSGVGRFGVSEIERGEIFRAFGGHPVKGTGAHFGKVLVPGPKKSSAEGAEQPFVSGGDHEVHAKLTYVEGNRTATLAGIEQQQSALRMAS